MDWCVRLADRIGEVGIKAAPGLPHEAVPPGWELEFIAVRRDLKEAVAWSPALAKASTPGDNSSRGLHAYPRIGQAVEVRRPGGSCTEIQRSRGLAWWKNSRG